MTKQELIKKAKLVAEFNIKHNKLALKIDLFSFPEQKQCIKDALVMNEAFLTMLNDELDSIRLET